LHEGHPGAAARLTSLYETHAADAFRYALHLTGRREDAEDVVQFVFLRAYGMLESGTELVNPRAWLIKATKHRSLNLIRDRRETPTAEAELPTGPQYDPDPAEAEALAEVRSTLWALPESQHHAFVLRHWSGLSQDEIADVLGTTPGAVESLLVRARTALLDDREQGTECAGVRRRLVQALAPTGGEDAHIRTCRRCRTAQARLLRASEFATAFALVPRPYVAHALAAVVPGFGAPAAAAAATTATGAGAGAGTGVATASSAAKVALATKIALATATAVVAVSAVHPVRSAVERVVLGTTPASAKTAPARTGPPARTAGGDAAAGPAQAATTAADRSSHGHSSAPHPGHGQGAPGKAKGKGKAKPPAAGGAGETKGKSGTAGSNGNGNANGAGKSGGNGKSATAGSNGNAVGKPASTGSKGKANGNSGGAGTATTGGASGSSHGNGKGNGKS
jgi:RNA polymerase sigma factor (sigma-70 family)